MNQSVITTIEVKLVVPVGEVDNMTQALRAISYEDTRIGANNTAESVSARDALIDLADELESEKEEAMLEAGDEVSDEQ